MRLVGHVRWPELLVFLMQTFSSGTVLGGESFRLQWRIKAAIIYVCGLVPTLLA